MTIMIVLTIVIYHYSRIVMFEILNRSFLTCVWRLLCVGAHVTFVMVVALG